MIFLLHVAVSNTKTAKNGFSLGLWIADSISEFKRQNVFAGKEYKLTPMSSEIAHAFIFKAFY